MSRDQSAPAAAASATAPYPTVSDINLYQVTIRHSDGTIKTIWQSKPLPGAIKCIALMRKQLNALWFMAQADLVGDRGPMPYTQRLLTGQFFANPEFPPDLDLNYAKRIALAICTPNQNFIPRDTFESLQEGDSPEMNEEKMRQQRQANYSIPEDVLHAAFNGDEDFVKTMLEINQGYLFYRGTTVGLSGHKFSGTLLQAALAANDVAPNEKSSGMVETILAHLKRFDPDNYQRIFEKQARELYEKSLKIYVDMQGEEIARLCKLGGELHANDSQQTSITEKLKQAQKNVRAYLTALRSDNLNTLFEAHQKAQADNAFDFQPYVDAILAIDVKDPQQQAQLDDVMGLINADTPAKTKAAIERTGVGPRESDDCRNKPFDQLTLVQKLNRFREKFVEHTQKEIIFNPDHILGALKHHDNTWDAVIADPRNDEKHHVIFSQLAGFAQRRGASESVKQDIRQGACYLVENEPRSRPSRFNIGMWRNSVVDISVGDSAIIDGFGYKFAVGTTLMSCRRDDGDCFDIVSKLMSSKNSKLAELYAAHPSSRPDPCGSWCVIQ